MEAHEILDGAWYTHPDYDTVWQISGYMAVECELVCDRDGFYWKANGTVRNLTPEFLEKLRWAWGGPTREVTITVRVPVGDPNRGGDIIDPLVNKLLSLVDLGLLGEDDWWVDE